MIEKLKNSRFLFWLVPIVLFFITIYEYFIKKTVKNANEELKDVKGKTENFKKEQENLLSNAKKHEDNARQIQEKINKLKNNDLDWHKTYKRKK